ncbi:MAG: UDP-glucose 4-epimerase GalE [Gammaproteobacteria bacterium]|nr:UDP-glucose 4-epimerase GalE [Gammaproteobacteria bacterium]
MNVLVTGGAGYIGSHTCVALLQAGFCLTVIDNLSNSHREALHRVEQITGKSIDFVQADICDEQALDAIFAQHKFSAVVHFAGLKAVAESVAQPLAYYQVNVGGTNTLLKVMAKYRVHQLVFSSSATVYGDPRSVPVTESSPCAPANPYGRSKLMVEQILADLVAAKQQPWKIASLRYFNPVGAHESGLIGEDPLGVPNNLMPLLNQVAIGVRPQLDVFGADYPTSDGTGVRDYIHVVDLAEGHVAALRYLIKQERAEYSAVNLGTGSGVSVLQMIASYQQATGQVIPYEIVARRPGDVAAYFADPSLAAEKFAWRARRSVEVMCADAWRWQAQNRNGYRSCSPD